jgi:hypothetical protein
MEKADQLCQPTGLRSLGILSDPRFRRFFFPALAYTNFRDVIWQPSKNASETGLFLDDHGRMAASTLKVGRHSREIRQITPTTLAITAGL